MIVRTETLIQCNLSFKCRILYRLVGCIFYPFDFAILGFNLPAVISLRFFASNSSIIDDLDLCHTVDNFSHLGLTHHLTDLNIRQQLFNARTVGAFVPHGTHLVFTNHALQAQLMFGIADETLKPISILIFIDAIGSHSVPDGACELAPPFIVFFRTLAKLCLMLTTREQHLRPVLLCLDCFGNHLSL